jgi:oxygen-independent coproporphyrinogen-3 oxidase
MQLESGYLREMNMNADCTNSTLFPLLASDTTCTDLDQFVALLGREDCRKDEGIIHVTVPFCDSICSFCNAKRFFKTHEALRNYLQALKGEIRLWSGMKYIESSDFGALYLHGGTPTTLSSDELKVLIQTCKDSFNFNADMELTVESTTHNLDAHKINRLLDCGLSRLYIGVQTFDNIIRKNLNRTDSSHVVAETILQAKKLGCEAIRIDLMYNLPGQDTHSWESDLLKAIELGVDNISIFRFHLYPNLKLAKELQSGVLPPMPESKIADDMCNVALDILKDGGYQQQYSSGFTLPGKKSRYYDLFYKYQHEGLGLGITNWFFSLLEKYSFRNTDELGSYIESIKGGALPISMNKRLSDDQLMKRFMSRGLSSAVDKTVFLKRFGVLPEQIFPDQICELEKEGLINRDDREIKTTPLGSNTLRSCRERFS